MSVEGERLEQAWHGRIVSKAVVLSVLPDVFYSTQWSGRLRTERLSSTGRPIHELDLVCNGALFDVGKNNIRSMLGRNETLYV